jgi:ATP-dependent Clp protease ATP-binding subunit ClpA
MKSTTPNQRAKPPAEDEEEDVGGCEIYRGLKALLVGQDEVIEEILSPIEMHQAGLSPEGRPIGIFLLLGPTGTGKTRTVEALARGSPRQPEEPNNGVATEDCNISLILFDEIEKAAPSMTRLLMGILDKATLRLGDNTTVDFQNTLIFLTSNLGAKTIQRATKPDFGFEALLPPVDAADKEKLQKVGRSAVRRKFSPEFVNRIDCVLTFKPLDRKAYSAILDQILAGFSVLLRERLGMRAFRMLYTPAARNLLLDKSTSIEFGARELKRTVQRHVMQPVAQLVAQCKIPPGGAVTLDVRNGEFGLYLRQ